MGVSETFVHPGEHRGIILVDDLRPVVGVVPVMEAGGGDEPLQETETPIDIRVEEVGPIRGYGGDSHGDEIDPVSQRLRQASQSISPALW